MAKSKKKITSEAEQKKLALKALAKRRKENSGKMKDNGSLYAGSAMYYYCVYCSVLTTVLAESDFYTKPKTRCSECESLERKGWLE